jgi:CRP-like cAMP-binding protein
MSENPLKFLSPDDWHLICASGDHLHFKPGDQIIRDGAIEQIIYVLRRGTVKVELLLDRRRIQIAQLGAGEVFGEMAFIEAAEASARAIAEDDVEVDAISGEKLYLLFDSFPGLATRFYRSLALTLSKRLRHVSAQLVELQTQTRPGHSPIES